MQLNQLIRQAARLPKKPAAANLAILPPEPEEEEHLVSQVAQMQSHMAAGVNTAMSDLLDMLNSAHHSNTLHLLSPPTDDIVSPAAHSGGSHHFICAMDAARSGYNWSRLGRPLHVETANGPTQVYYMCDIPTALGPLNQGISPTGRATLARVGDPSLQTVGPDVQPRS